MRLKLRSRAVSRLTLKSPEVLEVLKVLLTKVQLYYQGLDIMLVSSDLYGKKATPVDPKSSIRLSNRAGEIRTVGIFRVTQRSMGQIQRRITGKRFALQTIQTDPKAIVTLKFRSDGVTINIRSIPELESVFTSICEELTGTHSEDWVFLWVGTLDEPDLSPRDQRYLLRLGVWKN